MLINGLKEIDLKNIFGIIVNTTTRGVVSLLDTKHWFAIRPIRIDGFLYWFNLVSKLPEAAKFSSEEEVFIVVVNTNHTLDDMFY